MRDRETETSRYLDKAAESEKEENNNSRGSENYTKKQPDLSRLFVPRPFLRLPGDRSARDVHGKAK